MTPTVTRKPVIGMTSSEFIGTLPATAEFIGVADPKEIGGLDALIVTDGADQHKLIEMAAESGVRAILFQNPLATPPEEAISIVEACEHKGVRLAAAFPCRYSPAFQRLREQALAGAVGEVLAIRATSHGNAPEGKTGGVVLDRATHVADLNRWLLGQEATEVYAETGNRFYHGDCEDTAFISIKYGDIFATLDARWSHSKSYPADGEITLQVVGTGGVLDLDMFSQGLALSSANDGRLSWPSWGSDIHAGMISDFARFVLGKDPPNLATGKDSLRALEVVLAARRSAQRQEPVVVSGS